MKILLAEDEKRMAKALVELLTIEKYDVTHFADGESALTAGLTGIYDVIVLDVMMPQMGGFEVAKQLRRAISMLPAATEESKAPFLTEHTQVMRRAVL